ncbi:hypothetical protein bAD24_III11990 [Burkholderia sp. AD24]|nr:hypothetical protein bAD24_III11990 [Burkholderia sp. AD24]
MDEGTLARIGFNRLRHPVPMAKLMAVHAVADAIQSTNCGAVVWREYLEWISGLELESEVAEALLFGFLARGTPNVNAGELRLAVSRPSILSDYIVAHSGGSKILVNSWANCHSGEVPDLYKPADEAVSLTATTNVPPIIVSELDRLERLSGQPFRRQWEFEIERLIARYGSPEDGSFSYWTGGERDAVGRYIGRRSHYARSGFLRTIALAVEMWEMPENIAKDAGLLALPASLLYVQVPPGDSPVWAETLHNAAPRDDKAAYETAETLVASVAKQADGRKLLYLNAPLSRSDTYEGELRIVSCYVDGGIAESKSIFEFQDMLATGGGHAVLNRVDEVLAPTVGQRSLNLSSDVRLLPALVPDSGGAGYMTADIWQRFPCLPANYAETKTFRGIPRRGGVDLVLDGHDLGRMLHWNQQWRPWHRLQMGPPCGVALEVQTDCYSSLAPSPEWRLERHWEVHLISREKTWGDWEECWIYGRLDAA